MTRQATIRRDTKETRITLALQLDGGADTTVETGIGFFDHMLGTLAVHAGFSMQLSAQGDLCVDGHHTVEDVGIVLGQAISQALDTRAGIARFGQASIPMDESLASVALDLSGRAFLVYGAPAGQPMVGSYDTCLTEEFWRAVCQHAGLTLHITVCGQNAHHMTEAIFKACARALKQAVRVEGTSVPSTKGSL